LLSLEIKAYIAIATSPCNTRGLVPQQPPLAVAEKASL